MMTTTMTTDYPLIILLLLHFFSTGCSSTRPVTQFPTPPGDPTYPGLIISTVVIGPSGDTIYVGTINNIFVLDVDLKPIHRIETGPLWDHGDCILDSSNHRQCVTFRGTNISTSELKDNRNLLLYIDPTNHDRLIVCGSHRNGLCKYHATSDLREINFQHRNPPRFSVSDDSTIVFGGPGPEEDKTYLWMGAFKRLNTFDKYDSFLTNLGISVRSLGDDGGRVVVSPINDNVALSCEYSAEFVAAFGDSGFSYFLANMPAYMTSLKLPTTNCFTTKANLISKIIQVCQRDANLKSHVEVPLSCSLEDVDFNVLESATLITPGRSLLESYSFSKLRKVSEIDVEPDEKFIAAVLKPSHGQSTKHALCFYPMAWVRKIVLQNLRRCFSDSLGETGFQFPNSRKCKTSHMEIRDDYCRYDGCDNVQGPISGIMGVNSVPSLIIDTEDDITAMTHLPIQSLNTSHTVFVLGTNTGKLIKVLAASFDNSNHNRAYTIDKISSDDDTPLHKNIFISTNSKHLFASTERRVYKIPLSRCEEFSTCKDCLSSYDPLCGWCSLENRCSFQSTCTSEGFEDTWLSLSGSKLDLDIERCPSIVSLTPNVVNLDSNVDNITFSVMNLPTKRDRDSSFRCSFCIDGRHFHTNIQATEQLQLQHHYHHQQQHRYHQRQLTCDLIDLRGYLSDMTGERHLEVRLYGSVEGRPRSTEVAMATTEYIVISCTSFKNCSSCVVKGSNPTCGWCFTSNKCTKTNRCSSLTEEPLRNVKKCPRIVSQIETNLSAGISRNVEIKVKNLQEKTQRGEMEYFCKVDDIQRRASLISNSSIQCHIDPITWHEKEPRQATIQVFGKDKNIFYPIENVYKITVFNCSSMSHGDDCSLCQSLNLNEATRRFGCGWCEGECKTSCDRRDQPSCPDPKIEKVKPLSGPMQGGTMITLYGTNLGVNLTKVTVGDIECTTLEISEKVICRTNPSPRVTLNSPIKIQVDDKQRPITSSFTFAYLRPVIHSIHPNFGPLSGRTEVTIHGKDLILDGEHDFTVYIGTECLVNRSASNSSRIVCKRNAMPGTQPSLPLEIPVSLKIDWANVSNEKVKFQVRGDPVIFKLDPSSTFESGGCSIHVHGLNLNASSTPIINITQEDGSVRGIFVEPIFFNGTFMEFSFPRFRSGRAKLIFVFDEVRMSRPFEVTRDPTVNDYSAHLDKHSLEIQVENLLRGCRVDEINVFVGQFECNLTELTDSDLVCQLHRNITTTLGGERYHVNITLGNVELGLGRVQLFNKRPTFSRSDTKLPILVGGIVGGLLIMACMGVMMMMRKISSGRKRNNILIKRMQVLEKTISVQCKQSFAELQTHVSGFSSEISEAGIPYWDFKTYAFKFLFPMLKDHEVLRPPGSTIAAMSRNDRLLQLNQLLNNKSFLLTFVRTLEGHPKEFGIEDRSKIASWLTIIFINNFEYLTIVMKELLEELIRKSLERNTQKMMLRRTESVVEKMLSNWLCLTMYHYIKVEQVGKCLYRLCKAIEYQVDEGPVDAVTLESKFSLAEERLLRVKVDPQTLNVTIMGADSGPVACKLFDCDSITQAKCKAIKVLFKNKPHSTVPSSDNFELRLQVKGHEHGLLLKDEDSTSARCNDFIHINTLKHYNIKNGSTLLLTSVQKTSYEHDNVAVWRSQETMLFDSGSNWGTLKRPEVKNEPKLFHLVRQDDLTNNHFDGSEKLMSEVFLPRLLITKKALEDYIKRLLESMMTCDSSLPPTIKFLFDFFDATVQKYNILDQDVVHIWKSNSLPLRFWVSVLRNPDFVFDVEKSSLVDPCLAVIAQVFIDGCSTHKNQLGLDSSSAKLLFANEVQSYKTQVENFYSSIQRMQPVDTNSMDAYLIEVEREAENKFNMQAALHEVLGYVIKFQPQIQASLDEDVTCCSLKLPVKFNQMLA